MASAQNNDGSADFRPPHVEDAPDMVLLIEEETLQTPDAFADYVRTRPYEAVLLTAAAGMTLGLLIGRRH
jgi:ElaB/YqjD/DUF883 family membrane-anchored ribosome-binding protein